MDQATPRVLYWPLTAHAHASRTRTGPSVEQPLDPHTQILASGDWQQALLPDLEIIRPLGSGETAHVHLAREPALQRLVAVKVLRPEAAADPVARRRFEREAQSAARITHPNVTTIHRVGRFPDDEGTPYIVMEYVEGRTVNDIMAAGGTFDDATARRVLAAVASALAAAHDRGIVHRDVRPGNVFVENRTGRAILADFGIAALLDSGSAAATRLTQAGVLIGDVRRMSPEQIRGEPVTAQSDVYSFGVLAYELLTGLGPYRAETDAAVMAAHLRQDPRRLADLRSDVDPGLAVLIERCLAKEPNRRPLSSEIAAALAGGGAPAELLPAEAGPLAHFLGELRRRRVYRMVGGYGAVAIAILGATQVVYDAFTLSRLSYQVIVLSTLAGFPVALVLSWLYDLNRGGVRRTRPAPAAPRTGALVWGGLAASVLAVALLGWFLLRGT
jgi:tRNA A-37 threonylcarbamoyl transferase component Bud32